jgi:hypothetical protein
LRSLELVIKHTGDKEPNKEEDGDWVIPFLDSFEGLTSLHLLVINKKAVATTDRYWPSIFHHKKTLKRLVYHEHCLNDYTLLDCNKTMDNENIQDLFTQMNIECLGMCLSPMTPNVRIPLIPPNPILYNENRLG